MVTKKERLYKKLEDAQARINETFEAKDQQFYAGPTCLFLFGGLAAILFMGVIVALLVAVVALVWAVIRSSDKRAAEARYDAAVARGQELRDEYDDIEE